MSLATSDSNMPGRKKQWHLVPTRVSNRVSSCREKSTLFLCQRQRVPLPLAGLTPFKIDFYWRVVLSAVPGEAHAAGGGAGGERRVPGCDAAAAAEHAGGHRQPRQGCLWAQRVISPCWVCRTRLHASAAVRPPLPFCRPGGAQP